MTEKEKLDKSYARENNWLRWGPYLSERQWGTVREDYSEWETCWSYFPHDHARSRAYRWGEDGLMGFTDREGRLCFSLTLWNGKDPILKERLYGLTGDEGNHGEDVKELYFYQDSSPTHSYNKTTYLYPHSEFPYGEILHENRNRPRNVPEYDLKDSGAFDNGWFSVEQEIAKGEENELLIKINITNLGPKNTIHIIPNLWFRNTWDWGRSGEGYWSKPAIKAIDPNHVLCEHETLENFVFHKEPGLDGEWIFTENETNNEKLFNQPNASLCKDGFHEYIIAKNKDAVSSIKGTKVAFHNICEIDSNETKSVRFVLKKGKTATPVNVQSFEKTLSAAKKDCDDFYGTCIPSHLNDEKQQIVREAYAGLLFTKQFYYFIIKHWKEGDPSQPTPPARRAEGRNSDWLHLYNRDVISMPDKWEYPWYAVWDLAFHMLPFSDLDGQFAKDQLILFLREWYMHPNGQIPAYEFAFEDVNPPVHAWGVWRVYKLSAPKGQRDIKFLARCFQKLLLNFNWWINRKDPDGKNVFAGGFLGMDNIGVFDRSKPIPGNGTLYQADGTAWMAFFCTNMLAMACELAEHDNVYSDMASKFFEHYVSIVDAMNTLGGNGLWDDEDGFYYDQLKLGDNIIPLKIRSLVGLVPLLSIQVLDDEIYDKLPGFKKRTDWFLENRQDLAQNISCMNSGDDGERHLLAVPSRERLERILRYLFDENEFLSDWGIRSLSKIHESQPFSLNINGEEMSVSYSPGESETGMFGGNSNWRGPIWMPMNYLIVEALERYHYFYKDDLKVEFPTGSGNWVNLQEAAKLVAKRLISLFEFDSSGKRPCMGEYPKYRKGGEWEKHILYYEYFHAETGEGLGASHQTGWTALIARLVKKYG
ncbi:MAG: hypothetical protein NE327_08400 [Lentisphaeraceae bacterium]|nr:hypothetical protein [Lentisphaeraceae bacterium]